MDKIKETWESEFSNKLPAEFVTRLECELSKFENATGGGSTHGLVATKDLTKLKIKELYDQLKNEEFFFEVLSQIQMDGFQKLQDDLEKVIEKDDSSSSITTDSEETKNEFRNLNDRLKHIFHTNKFQIIIVCFVIVDCLLVITELLLDLKVFPESASESLAPHILHYTSISILGLFLLETLVRLAVFRLEFFKHKMEVFDAVVIIVSFVLDIIFRNKEGVESGVGLLIVLRLWRVMRILNGIVLSVKIQADKRIQRERRLRDACEQELMKYREYCAAQESEIETLRGLLRKHGIRDMVPSEIPKPVSRIDVVAEVNHILDKAIEAKESSPALP